MSILNRWMESGLNLNTNADNNPNPQIDTFRNNVQTSPGFENIHRTVETNPIRNAGKVSYFSRVDIRYPRDYFATGGDTYRSEIYTINPTIRGTMKTGGWFSLSIYYPSSNVLNDRHNELVCQFLPVGFSGPHFGIDIWNGNLGVRMSMSGPDSVGTPTENRFILNLGAIETDQWVDLICYFYFSNDLNTGRMKVWKNRKLARLHNPVTKEPWVNPTVTTPGIHGLYIATPTKGVLPTVINENGSDVSLADWFGRTRYTLDVDEVGSTNYQFKHGLYKSSWNQTEINETNPEQSIASDGLPVDAWEKEVYLANMAFADISSPDYTIFRQLEPNGLDAEDGIDYSLEPDPGDPDPDDPIIIPPSTGEDIRARVRLETP